MYILIKNEFIYRLYYIFYSWFITFIIAFIYSKDFIYQLFKPFLNKLIWNTKFTLIVFHVTDLFFIFLKVSFFISLIILIPLFYFHFYFFSLSLIKNNIKKNFFFFFFLSTLLIFLFFFYYQFFFSIIFNLFLKFYMMFFFINYTLLFTLYISIYMKYFIFFLFFFNFILSCHFFKINFKLTLKKKTHYVLFILLLLVWGILTPPDILSQIIFTFFSFLWIEFYIFLYFFINVYKIKIK